MAELCGKCKGGMYIMSVGKCVECGGFAGSGAFKLCKACSAKLGQCEHCRAALRPAKAKPDTPKPAPKDQPAKIDRTKSANYRSGKWEYRYTIKSPGTRSERSRGVLLFGATEVIPASELNDYHRTPWGNLYWVGDGKAFGRNGWMPEMHGSRDGWELPPPIGARPYLKPVTLGKADHGKTVRLVLGQPVHVRLEGNPMTGFEWRLVKVEGEAVKWSGKTYVRSRPRPNRRREIGRAEGWYGFTLEAVKRGRATVTLEYALPSEKDKPPAETFKVTFDVHPDRTAERVKSLKRCSDNFWLSLSYHGPDDKPHPSLRLRTPERSPKPGPNVLDVHISRAQAAKIIDHLAADGLLARSDNTHARPHLRPTGPTYVLTVNSDKTRFEEGLGWDLEMLHRLDGLQAVLPEGPAKQMDKLLGRMAGHRLKWAGEVGRKQAAADIKAGKARILYYGKPWSADKPLVDEATRLPVEVISGCTITEELRARVNAYNAAIREWAAKRRGK